MTRWTVFEFIAKSHSKGYRGGKEEALQAYY